MKKLKALLIVSSVITVLCWMVGCNQVSTSNTEYSRLTSISTIEYAGCEYVLYRGSGVTHKGNCKYCADRNLKPHVFSLCDSSVYEYRDIHDGNGGWTKVSHDATFIRDSAYRTQTLNINSNTGNIQIGPQN